MAEFVGRAAELGLLRKRLDQVTASGAGTAVSLRGRRQVGKSRLVQEFCNRAGVPYMFFTATKGASSVESVATFLDELMASSLTTDRELIPSQVAGGWPDAFRVLASTLPPAPAIVVMDEVPWLAEQDDLFDGALQTAWDRLLSARPVLLLLLGSDIHMMERLTAYDRPFFGRADNMVLGPLNPAETADALGLGAADAIDAHLVTGGLPGIIRSWPRATPALTFLEAECADPASPVFSIPESALMAEFATPDQARRVIEAVGSGDRTFSNIAATAGSRQGSIPSGSLSPLLHRLTEEKRVFAVDHPLSIHPGKPALYRVADSNLRLYLAFGRTAQEQARRGRPEAGIQLLHRRWTTWRGRAVEPLIREALELAALAGTLPWPDVTAVGAWWNRQFDPEIDLIGADRAPVAQRLFFAGSIKWLGSPFDNHDLAALRQAATHAPGFTHGETGTAVVSLAGAVSGDGADLMWGPSDVLGSWQTA
ncbi:AAA family ATPase [Kibdelosporangium philippinense]|uniref:AAA family ATPase n=1 Tax=Kibdelosporangium philippinense TaxID=211113 RepID=A0ABS8ZM32_9PSEU|nr:ATP-binding protein [Kibdelosporangium philippinense]MCE7008856.1 AAA family ATPase [Kibdelosporangium philippinense]